MDVGLITEDDKRLIVDHFKVRRVQEKLMKSLDQKFSLCEDGGISYIFFDGRIDTIKVMLKSDNSDKQFTALSDKNTILHVGLHVVSQMEGICITSLQRNARSLSGLPKLLLTIWCLS